MTPSAWFAQQGARCRLEWGWQGAMSAAERGDILVVVDVLSFSTTVATAIHSGGSIRPCVTQEEAERAAGEIGAEIAVPRRDVPQRGRFSLSPLTYLAMEPGVRVALPSPNGATCCHYGRAAFRLFVGGLVNARAIAEVVAGLLEAHPECSATVLACGERWHPSSLDGALRFALEDYLGAGAILSYLPHSKSPEASACEAAFRGAQQDLEAMLWECGSGIELRDKGYAEDVTHAAQLNGYMAVPTLRNGLLEGTTPDV
ncbi:MAG TPA: 2-phosphosulfolactate phosphatase [Chthonomonadaceae bacterium]|nr:2-phosphosulfolactate phosphatase [Chthonomonadaceae bacterium]